MHQITNPFDQLDRRLSAIEELLVKALHPNAPAFQPKQEKGLIPAAEFRKKYKISKTTERARVQDGTLHPVYVGRKVFYDESEFVDSVKRRSLAA